MRSAPAVILLLALSATPAVAMGSGDCGTSGNIAYALMTTPFHCEGTGDGPSPPSDDYGFHVTAGQTIHIHFASSAVDRYFLFAPSQRACCEEATANLVGARDFAFSANESGEWLLVLYGDYDVHVALHEQVATGRYLAPAIEQLDPRRSLARETAPGGVGDGIDGAWIELAAPATGAEFVMLHADSTIMNENVQLTFFDAKGDAIVHAECADRDFNVVQRCTAPARATHALAEGFLSAGFSYTLTYHH